MELLKRFLSSMTVNERKDFAARCRTSWPFLRNIAYGYRLAGEKLCVSIEKESGGAVTRRDLRPDDWHEIWPELKGPPNA
ncbi:transcriptional regulator [Neopusillimonas aromaticivorans]|uniref:transcriptional regulator n=1 Tax=Neopusillimonas aromaticivorans TaxID=2979868 RepID=UPI00259A51EA|nr:YdaS family helix-turn-helix protein [Neopusillimonas aromaticivorans]WJJ94022.1 YdaS family helix-turn-helix protein [Neopusillimonas aromaticivorans]